MPTGDWSPHARAIAQRVLDRMDDVIEGLGTAFEQEVPEYAALGTDVLRRVVLPVSREIVSEFFLALVAGRHASVDDVRSLQAMGRQRLEQGIPLEPMLHVYRIAGRVVWDTITEVADPGEFGALGQLGTGWIDYIDRASSVAAAGYLEASHEQIRRADARRDALLDSLLAVGGEAEAAALATEHQIVLAGAYIPVGLRGDRVAESVDRGIAAAPPGTVGGVRGSIVLLLCAAPPDPAQISQATDAAAFVLGRPAAPGAALRLAAADVVATVELTRLLGRCGTVEPGQLLAERLGGGDERIRSELRVELWERLAVHDRTGMLRKTVATYLGCGSIPETAAGLHVHANTVSYRLGRVHELTGLDPRQPRDAMLLGLASIAAELEPSPAIVESTRPATED